MANEQTTEASNPPSQATPCGSYPATVCSKSESDTPRTDKWLRVCIQEHSMVVCARAFERELREVNSDLQAAEAYIFELEAWAAAQVENGSVFSDPPTRILPLNPTENRAAHLVRGTVPPVVLPKDLNVSSENRQASRPSRGTGTASASSKGNSPNAHF